MEKLAVVTGDVTLPGFGLSPSDLRLLTENVSVVFNSAATVKFDEELKDAIEMNVKGPMKLLEISRQMKHLEVQEVSMLDKLENESQTNESMSFFRRLCTYRLLLTISIVKK